MKILKIVLWLLFITIAGLLIYWAIPITPLPDGVKSDQLVVYKSKRKLEYWSGDQVIKTYTISLGGNPIGHKEVEGDSKTPEGLYYINDKNPHSGYHLNLGISYPNAADKKRNNNPGGQIKIHGLKNGRGIIGKFQRFVDWTNGCIAVTNAEMEELYHTVPIGTPIYIHP